MVLVVFSLVPILNTNSATNPVDVQMNLNLTIRDQIYIDDDGDFTAANGVTSGNGTKDDPYIIEEWNITESSGEAIYIGYTTKYFIIRNCYVNGGQNGIRTYHISAGTAIVTNNYVTNRYGSGIYIDSADNVTISYNICYENDNEGIYLDGSDYCIVDNNICYDNSNGIRTSGSGCVVTNNLCYENRNLGVRVYGYTDHVIASNICENNNDDGMILLDISDSIVFNNSLCNNGDGIGENGIEINNCESITVSNNTINQNYVAGIYIHHSGSCVIKFNVIKENTLEGIYGTYSDHLNISYNLLQENDYYGIELSIGAENCSIHHNVFIDNYPEGSSQAYDYATTNTWYDTVKLEGNYWSDYSGEGVYNIDGGSSDPYPLTTPVESEPPIISAVTILPSNPTNEDDVKITAIVEDISGLESVTIHYRVDGSSWIDLPMTIDGGSLYSVILPAFDVDELVEFYISAIDKTTTANEAVNDNSGLYFSFTVLENTDSTSFVLLPILVLQFMVLSIVIIVKRRKS
ncbi:MAG: hypothetical protein GOP50_13145 [Candidatus Heimdallarchaeota archaeon]|nr:hypothetical protein [Candidatus Heimdallarchaeota archaeon]